MRIVSRLQTVAREHSHLTAIEYGERRISYGQLMNHVDALTAGLQALGVADCTVMTFLDPSPELVSSMLAIVNSGGLFCPVDPVLPERRIQLLIGQAQPHVMISSGQWLDVINQIGEALDQVIPVLLMESVETPEFGSACHQFGSNACLTSAMDTSRPLPYVAIQDIAMANGPIDTGINRDNCYLYFTSGSTGTPKGIVGRQSSLLHFIDWESQYLLCDSSVRVSQLTLQTFDPFLRELLLPLYNGGTLCIPESRDLVYDTAKLYQWLVSERVTVMHSVPTLFEQLLTQVQHHSIATDLKAVLLAGEPLKPGLVKQFFQSGLNDSTSLHNLYGPTETTLAKFFYSVMPTDQWQAAIPVGRPLPGTTLSLLPADFEDAASSGHTVGEIVIHTPHGSAGYLRNGSDYTAIETEEGYATGDLGYVRNDGELVVVGRRDFQIKIAGQRVELGEIEHVIEQFAGVRSAVVHPHYLRDQLHIAVYFTEAQLTVDTAQLKAYLQQRLPDAWVPVFYLRLVSLPLTPNGKVDRKSLPVPDWDQLEARLNAYAAPGSLLEIQLAEIWQDVLAVPQIGRNDSFFDLGGRSILAMKLVTRLNQKLGRSISMAKLLANPTIKSLAKILEDDAVDSRSTLADYLSRSEANVVPMITLEQQRLALFQVINPDNPVYNMPYQTEWRGHLDLHCLQRAINALVAKQPSLRTGVVVNQGKPSLDIQNSLSVEISLQDFSDISLDFREWEIKQWLSQLARTPLDIGQPGLLKVYVARYDARRYCMVFVLHHIIADAWSFEVFWNQLLTAYHQLLSGRALNGAGAISTALLSAYAQWQRDYRETTNYHQAKAYWLDQLKDAPPVIQLPLDRRRPSELSYRGAKLGFTLSQTTSEEIRRLAQRLNVSLFSLCLTLFKTFLFKYSGQDDLVVGVPFANREHRELESVIGFLVNMLCYRSYPQTDLSLVEFAEQVHQLNLKALEHSTMPFEDLVELLSPERSLNHSPLFQVMFAFQEPFVSDGPIRGAEISKPQMMDIGISKYDFTLQVWDEKPCIKCEFEYSLDLFSAATVSRMAKNFEYLVDNIVADPEKTMGRLTCVCQDEQEQLVQLNQTDRIFNHHYCIQDLISQQAQVFPTITAVCYQSQQLTYCELEVQTNQLANHLIDMGIQPGQPVAVSIPRSIELVIGFLAVLKAGAVYVPVDPDYPLDRRQYMLEDSGAVLILTVSQLVEHYRRTDLNMVLLDEWSSQELTGADSCPVINVGPLDVAYVIYTSGSTGKPKGVEVLHRGVCNLAEEEIRLLEVGKGSRVLQFASFSFDTSIWEIVMTLASGATLVMADRLALIPGPELLRQLLEQEISHVTLPASALAALPYHPLPKLKVLITAGEACSLDLLKLWGPGRKFVNSYGPTETTVSATNAVLDAHADEIHIGRPLANTQVWVLDQDQNLVPIGVPGELCVGGVGVAKGYLGKPQLTREKFITDPFTGDTYRRLYRTGDLVKMLPNGNICYLGRIDHQVKIRGFRIELGEIEIRLKQYSGVRDAIVIVRDDVIADHCLVAYVVIDQRQDDVANTDLVNTAELKNHLSNTLPDFMVPARIVIMNDFPRLPNNKVDRNSLPAPLAMDESPSTLEPPQTEQERIFATLWCELLGIHQVGRHDSFFVLGGHSLLAARFVALLQQRYDMELSIRHFFTQPTLSYLATKVTASSISQTLKSNYSGELVPLTTAQKRLWFLYQQCPRSCQYTIGQLKTFDPSYDPELLATAIQQTVVSHDVFGLRFKSINGIPLQVRLPQDQVPLIAIEPARLSEQQIQDLAQEMVNEPLDLIGGPGYKLRLVTNTTGCTVLIIAIHHLLIDENGLQIFENEIDCFYQCELNGGALLTKDRKVDFLDFAQWEAAKEAQEDSSEFHDSLKFWRDYLGNGVEQLELPKPSSSSTNISSTVAVHSQDLDRGLSESIVTAAHKLQMSPMVVWLGLMTLLLRRTAGVDNVNFAMPVSIRDQSDTHSIIGFFLNTVIFSHKVVGAETGFELLKSIKDNFSQLIAHQQMPLDRLVDALQLPRQGQQGNPVNVMFVYRDQVEHDTQTAAVTQTIDVSEPKFDFTLFVTRHRERFEIKLESDRTTVAEDWQKQVPGYLECLAKLLVQGDHTPVSAYSLMSEKQWLRQLAVTNKSLGWRQNGCTYRSVVEQFEDAAKHHPNAIALRCNDRNVDYATLNKSANQIAYWILNQQIDQRVSAGGEQEPPVAICITRSYLLVATLLGVLKSGNSYLPIDPEYPNERIDYLLEDSNCHILICDAVALPVSLQRSLPETVLDTAQFDQELAGLPDGDLGIDCAPSSLAYVIYTSGSTGKPKGVAVDHGGLSHYIGFALRHYQVDMGQGSVLHSSIAFDATVTSLFAPLLVGKCLTIVPQENALEHLVDCVQQSEPFSFIKMTPAHLDLFVHDHISVARFNAHFLVLGGDNLAIDSCRAFQRKFPQVRIINEYGPTETVVGCCIHEFQSQGCNETGSVSIGLPIPDAVIYVLDNDMQPVPAFAVGEIYIGGKGMAQGYWRRPDITAERFINNPYQHFDGYPTLYRTGDLAKSDEAGLLHCLGRRDRQVKINGYRIEPGEIEALIKRLPGIQDVVLMPVSAGQGQASQLVAYIVKRPGGAVPSPEDILVREISSQLRDHLPAYMIPAQFVFITRIPITQNGKIDYPTLIRQAPEHNESLLERHSDLLSSNQLTAAQKSLTDVWQRVLKRDFIHLNESFFGLGGDSIKSLQVVHQARQLGLEITVRDIFEQQTLQRLALQVEANKSQQNHRIKNKGAELTLAPDSEGAVFLTPMQHWLMSQDPLAVSRFNQAYLYHVGKDLNLDKLEACLCTLVNRHAGIRLGFRPNQHTWQAFIGKPITAFSIERLLVDKGPQKVESISRLIEQQSFSFDIADPPMLKVVHIATRDSTDRLLLVGHHGIVDNVSWQVILEDLESLYFDRPLREEAVSPGNWHQCLRSESVQRLLMDDQTFWAQQSTESGKGVLPLRAVDPSDNRVVDAKQLRVTIPVEVISRLTTVADSGFGARLHELIVAALVEALLKCTQRDSVAIEIESHGRDDLEGQVDNISRAIGWFTTLYPLVFQTPAKSSESMFPWAAFVGSVKETMRRVPHQGIGYAYPVLPAQGMDICFNYLGNLLDVQSEMLLGLADEKLGSKYHPDIKRRHLIELDAYLKQGELVMDWTFGGRLLDKLWVEGLAERVRLAVHELADVGEKIQERAQRYFTPSDFSTVALTQADIDSLCTQYSSITDIYPLTPVQEGMLFHSTLDPSAGLYHEQVVYRVDGHLCRDRFTQVWQRQINRYDILRTAFQWQQVTRPVQIVLQQIPFVIEWLEGGDDPQAVLEHLLQSDLNQPFDVTQAPLLRLSMVVLSDSAHWLVLSHHHGILDGWSLTLLLDDFREQYTTPSFGSEVRNPALVFKDYVIWREQNQNNALAWWQQQFSSLSDVKETFEPTALPLASNGDGGANLSTSTFDITNTVKVHHQKIGDACVSAMAHATQTLHFTGSTLVFAAWGWLLQQVSLGDSACFGVTTSGRSQPLSGLDELVGLTINTLPMIVRPENCEFVVDYLAEVQQLSVGLQQHCQVGLSQLQSHNAISSEMFKTIVVHENYPGRPDAGGDIKLTFECANEATNYPLTLVVSSGGKYESQNLTLKWVYHQQVYGDDQIATLADLFEQALLEIGRNLFRPLAHCRLTDDATRHNLLVGRQPAPRDISMKHVVQALDETAKALPLAPAIVFESEVISYRSLYHKVCHFQRLLADQGCGQGEVVGIYLPRSPDLVAAILAVLRSGSAYLPIDTTLPAGRVAFMLADAAVVTVFTLKELQTTLPDNFQPICIDPRTKPVIDDSPTPEVAAPLTATDIAYVIYTSGSTGKPKGTPITHLGLANYLSFARREYAGDRPVHSSLHSPISFDATITSLFLPLITGGTLYLVPEGEELSGLADILAHIPSPQLLKVTPAHLALLGEQLLPETAQRLDTVIVGGEALYGHQIRALAEISPDTRIVNEYGPTETVVGCCVYDCLAKEAPSGAIPIGWPIDNTTLFVLNSSGEPCPDGVAGELYIAGPGVSPGYLNRPTATARAFDPQLPWAAPEKLYRTGDMVKYPIQPLSNSSHLPSLDYIGRKDSQVKVRGYRIELGELEQLLRQNPLVADCAVIVCEGNASQGEQLVAFVVPMRLEAAQLEHELLIYARHHLPHYMVPNRWVTVSELPLTANGKVDRKRLHIPDLVLASNDDTHSANRNLSHTESRLLAIWSDVLGVPVANNYDDFFLLGGHSLLAIRIVSRANDEFNLLLPLRVVFDFPTVNTLAEEIDRQHLASPQKNNPASKSKRIERVARKGRSKRETV